MVTHPHKDKISGIPDELLERIDKIVNDKSRGYYSRGEFIREAIRDKLTSFDREVIR